MTWDVGGFDRYQIEQMERGYAQGVNIDIYANKKYSHAQMHQIRLGLLDGDDITKYVNETFSYGQMREVRFAMKEQHDPSILADRRFSSAQMAAINMGMNWCVDVSRYAYPEVPFYKMLKMKDALILEAKANDLLTKQQNIHMPTKFSTEQKPNLRKLYDYEQDR